MAAIAIFSAASTDLRAEVPRVDLHWIDTHGNLLELKWKSRVRWVWRQKLSIGAPAWEPWLQVGVAVPLPLSVLDAEDLVEEPQHDDASRASGWSDESELPVNSEGSRLVIEAQAPEVTRRVRIEDLDEQVSEGGLAVRANFSRPSLLVHSSCQQLGLRIVPVVNDSGPRALPSFLFFGASCVRRPNGAVEVHWFTSTDAMLVGSPAFSRLTPPTTSSGIDADRSFVVSVGERRLSLATPANRPGPVLEYEVQWTPVVRRVRAMPSEGVVDQPPALPNSRPSFLSRTEPLASLNEPVTTPLAWLPTLMVSCARGYWSIALRARYKSSWGEIAGHLPLVSLRPGAFPAQDVYQFHAGPRILKNFPLFFTAHVQYTQLAPIPEVEGFQFGPKLVAAFEKPTTRWAGRASVASLYGVGGASLHLGTSLRFALGELQPRRWRVDLLAALDAWLYRVTEAQSLSWIRPSLGVKIWF